MATDSRHIDAVLNMAAKAYRLGQVDLARRLLARLDDEAGRCGYWRRAKSDEPSEKVVAVGPGNLLAMSLAIVLDFVMDLRLPFYLVLATMVAVAAVAWVHLFSPRCGWAGGFAPDACAAKKANGIDDRSYMPLPLLAALSW